MQWVGLKRLWLVSLLLRVQRGQVLLQMEEDHTQISPTL
jgi:hypothetical protein